MYPSREQVAAYMVSYAEKYGLTRMIRLSTAVERIEPVGERGRDGWRVSLSDGSQHLYKGVVVANGHLWDQNIPAVGKGFTGRSIHSRVVQEHERNRRPRAGRRLRQLRL